MNETSKKPHEKAGQTLCLFLYRYFNLDKLIIGLKIKKKEKRKGAVYNEFIVDERTRVSL